MAHRERHRSERIGWLRAAVLGANDGIVSTASLVIGVAPADAARPDVLIAGIAGLVAGALSMAAGEYVSVVTRERIQEREVDQIPHTRLLPMAQAPPARHPRPAAEFLWEHLPGDSAAEDKQNCR